MADDDRLAHYHEVLQWLRVRIQDSNHSRFMDTSVQAFPNPPQDVIEIWQNHLMAAYMGGILSWHTYMAHCLINKVYVTSRSLTEMIFPKDSFGLHQTSLAIPVFFVETA
jgi:hypothetical protein